ncbi:MAG TPA: hypothetical protein VF094_08190 [Gaiellaceae bacterium]
MLAAAHATCFAMALALVLGEAGTPPEPIATTATFVLDEVGGAPRITRVALEVRGRVDGIDGAGFRMPSIVRLSSVPSRMRSTET